MELCSAIAIVLMQFVFVFLVFFGIIRLGQGVWARLDNYLCQRAIRKWKR